MPPLDQMLAALTDSNHMSLLKDIQRGIEKESLRIDAEGALANTPHPQALGSALTHGKITTDYSEALLEFITSPTGDIDAVLEELRQIHHFTYQNINSEKLWVTSMPCVVAGDESIPVARYGHSNVGKMKTVYREGLGHRYGRAMQAIAGIHYNFSLPDAIWPVLQQQHNSTAPLQDFKTEIYFGLIRNFRRYFWLLLYLFGAAPAVCRSFVRDREHQLIPVGDDDHSLHTPYATSLRMGNLGYQSDAQQALVICYNNLNSYLGTLCNAITQPHPDYVALGVQDQKGNYQQLNTGLLQIENEFYSSIRPKRTTQSGETALNALHQRGVEYIEVRCLDLNPYEPLGINAEQIRFLDTFLLFCALEHSPNSNSQESQQIQENQMRTVYRGRDPELLLLDGDRERPLREWGEELLKQLQPVADLLDKANESTDYRAALQAQSDKLADASLTPSAQVLSDMREQSLTFYQLALKLANQHQQGFVSSALDDQTLSQYEQLAAQSLSRQQEIEASDSVAFEVYLEQYYQQYQCCTEGEPTQTVDCK